MAWDNTKSNFTTRDDVPADQKLPASEWNTMVSDQKSRITGIDVADDGSVVLKTANVNFATNLTVTDDGDGTVSVDATDTNLTDEEVEDIVGALITGGTNVSVNYDDNGDTLTINATDTDTRTDVSEATSTVVSDTEDINFEATGAATVSVTDDGDGSATISVDATDTNTDTRTDVSEDGSTVVSQVTDINFGANVDVIDDGDGTVTVEASSSTDTRTDVSDDGTTVVSEVADINFGDNVSVTDDGDGTVTVTASGGGGTSDTTLGYNIDASQYNLVLQGNIDTRENELDARGSNIAII